MPSTTLEILRPNSEAQTRQARLKVLLLVSLLLCQGAWAAEVCYPTNQTQETAQYGVLLLDQADYLGVLVTQKNYLSIRHYMRDFKPMGNLTTKMVQVEVETRGTKKRLWLKNQAGFLTSNAPLPGPGPWTLAIRVQQSRDVPVQTYRFEYQPEWISKRW